MQPLTLHTDICLWYGKFKNTSEQIEVVIREQCYAHGIEVVECKIEYYLYLNLEYRQRTYTIRYNYSLSAYVVVKDRTVNIQIVHHWEDILRFLQGLEPKDYLPTHCLRLWDI